MDCALRVVQEAGANRKYNTVEQYLEQELRKEQDHHLAPV